MLAEVVNDDGTMTRLPGLRAFADEHGLALISIAQLIEYRRYSERMVSRVVQTIVPNAYGEWRAIGYLNSMDGTEHLALVLGDLDATRKDGKPGQDVLVRMHSECLTGDVFGSQRCDCGTQLNAAMAAIAAEGRGIVVYLRGHEGRGIGLLSKLRAYQLQDAGADTVDANTELGFPVDAREYSTGAQILADLGVSSLRLLTNNPAKIKGLSDYGLKVTGTVALPVTATPHNLRYLIAKRDRLGHLIELAEPAESAEAAEPAAAEGCRARGRGRRRRGGKRCSGERSVSGTGRPGAEPVHGAGLRLAIVATRWNAEITDALLDRAVAAAHACGVESPSVVRVAGAVELPVVAAALARQHDAVACVGTVIRGGTPHFELRLRRGDLRPDQGRARHGHAGRQRGADL